MTPETTTKLFRNKPVVRPSEDELFQLASLLNSHKKVTIFCGLGAREADTEIIQLAERLKAPVAYSYKAKMAIQHNNPYEVGLTGLLGIPSAYHSMHECELLVLLGTDFPYTPFMPIKNKIVQIDIKPENLGRRAKLDLGLCGDVRDTLHALMPMVEMKTETTNGFFYAPGLRQVLDKNAVLFDRFTSFQVTGSFLCSYLIVLNLDQRNLGLIS